MYQRQRECDRICGLWGSVRWMRDIQEREHLMVPRMIKFILFRRTLNGSKDDNDLWMITLCYSVFFNVRGSYYLKNDRMTVWVLQRSPTQKDVIHVWWFYYICVSCVLMLSFIIDDTVSRNDEFEVLLFYFLYFDYCQTCGVHFCLHL
jgi:hypothetical protein